MVWMERKPRKFCCSASVISGSHHIQNNEINLDSRFSFRLCLFFSLNAE